MANAVWEHFDGFCEESLNPRDIASGILLIEEAGGEFLIVMIQKSSSNNRRFVQTTRLFIRNCCKSWIKITN